MKRDVWQRVFNSVVEGLIVATMIAGVFLAMTSLIAKSGYFAADFARRADGGCSGWTSSLTWRHMVGDVMIYYSYIIIAITIIRRHPIVHRIPSSRFTVLLITTIFTTCAMTHLFDAIANFYPVYRPIGDFKIFTGIIGLVGGTLICHNLVSVFDVVRVDKAKMDRIFQAHPDLLAPPVGSK